MLMPQLQHIFPSTPLCFKIILICSHPLDSSGLPWKMQEIPDKEICEIKLQFMTFTLPLCTELSWHLRKVPLVSSAVPGFSGYPIRWSGRLIPTSLTLWPLYSNFNYLGEWWTSVSQADDVSLQLAITVRRPTPEPPRKAFRNMFTLVVK